MALNLLFRSSLILISTIFFTGNSWGAPELRCDTSYQAIAVGHLDTNDLKNARPPISYAQSGGPLYNVDLAQQDRLLKVNDRLFSLFGPSDNGMRTPFGAPKGSPVTTEAMLFGPEAASDQLGVEDQLSVAHTYGYRVFTATDSRGMNLFFLNPFEHSYSHAARIDGVAAGQLRGLDDPLKAPPSRPPLVFDKKLRSRPELASIKIDIDPRTVEQEVGKSIGRLVTTTNFPEVSRIDNYSLLQVTEDYMDYSFPQDVLIVPEGSLISPVGERDLVAMSPSGELFTSVNGEKPSKIASLPIEPIHIGAYKLPSSLVDLSKQTRRSPVPSGLQELDSQAGLKKMVWIVGRTRDGNSTPQLFRYDTETKKLAQPFPAMGGGKFPVKVITHSRPVGVTQNSLIVHDNFAPGSLDYHRTAHHVALSPSGKLQIWLEAVHVIAAKPIPNTDKHEFSLMVLRPDGWRDVWYEVDPRSKALERLE